MQGLTPLIVNMLVKFFDSILGFWVGSSIYNLYLATKAMWFALIYTQFVHLYSDKIYICAVS
jgi:hypothetical protein